VGQRRRQGEEQALGTHKTYRGHRLLSNNVNHRAVRHEGPGNLAKMRREIDGRGKAEVRGVNALEAVRPASGHEKQPA
jgi:hypothetical protein